MAVTKLGSYECPQCHFPVAGRPGESLKCPACGVQGRIAGIEIPNELIFFLGGILVGFIVGRSRIGAEIAKKFA
jgi:hypothetical protein